MAYVYSSAEVKINWGEVPITGFTEDSFIVIEHSAPQQGTTMGIDGTTAFSPKFDFSGTCSITLKQGSVGNRLLSLSTKEQEESPTGELLQSNMTITDSSGAFNYLLQNAVLVKQPSVSYGKVASDGSREWVFYSPQITYKGEIEQLRSSTGQIPQTFSGEYLGAVGGRSTLQQILDAII